MPKNFQHEKWAFDEGAVARQKIIVPEKLPRKRWRSDGNANDKKQKRAQPSLAEELGEAQWQFESAGCAAKRGESVHLKRCQTSGD